MSRPHWFSVVLFAFALAAAAALWAALLEPDPCLSDDALVAACAR